MMLSKPTGLRALIRTRIRLRLACCILALFATEALAQTPPVSAAIERVTALARSIGLSGEIVLADRAGATADQALGLADREDRRPHRIGERWLWASVTKQVTALLAMQQIEVGKLSLDGTIKEYLPEFVGTSGGRVTIRQLLQHLSGLPNPNDTPPDTEGIPGFYRETGAPISNTSRALGFCSGKPSADPGTRFAYNNCDYLVLGAILERVTGKPYATLVDQTIAGPVGLTSLALASSEAPNGDGAATGYTEGGRRYPPINVATFGAAGALTGTARDLIALDLAQLSDTLLKPQTREILWDGDAKIGYEALGVWSFSARLAGCTSAVALIERRGDVAGIQVRNVIAPGLGRAMAVFVNDDTEDFGEIWQGRGLSFDLLSAAFCPPLTP